MAASSSASPSAHAVAAHVRAQLALHRQQQQRASTSQLQPASASEGLPPLLVGLQGPQGSGKTTLTRQLQRLLGADAGSEGHEALRVVVFSLDDLYLTHADQLALAAAAPGNKLLAGRGQPGTHDVPLGTSVLRALRQLNGSAAPLALPVYDKAAYGGAGDRAEASVEVQAPVDVVLFEGWCLGFSPLDPTALRERYAAAAQRRDAGAADEELPYFLDHALAHLEDLSARLAAYEDAWWAPLDACVQLAPSPPEGASEEAMSDAQRRQALETVFVWRTEAEEQMKTLNGGRGMSAAEVRSFVRRYMPSYELFADGVLKPHQPWHGRGLRLELGPQRQPLRECHF